VDLTQAVAEEFRVRMAQYAVFGSQPSSYLLRQKQELGYKPFEPDLPDQMRAPMTLAQIWDAHKAKRSPFEVKLIPVFVEDFAKNRFEVGGDKPMVKEKVREPGPAEEEAFFDEHKAEQYDPSSPKWGIDNPQRASFHYLYADPTSPDFFNLARAVGQIKRLQPFGDQEAIAKEHLARLKLQYEQETSRVGLYREAALLCEKDHAAPVLAYYASRHPQSVASLIAASTFAPEHGLAGFLAWGTKQHPLTGNTVADPKAQAPAKIVTNDDAYQDALIKLRAKGEKVLDKIASNDEELEVALTSEAKRRAPAYATLFAASFNQSPLGIAATSLCMDPTISPPFMRAVPVRPTYTTETVQRELEDMIARRTAEEWARARFLTAMQALKKASSAVAPAENFRGELGDLVPKLKLTHGPADGQKGNYYDEFTIGQATELEPLREAYLKYIDQINLFEGRDTPERRLKPEDFHKMFFGNEPFAAIGKYQAKPWPPEVDSTKTRGNRFLPQALHRGVKGEDYQRMKKFLDDQDPDRPEGTKLALYKTAAMPILFWRTDEINPERRGDYKQVIEDLKQLGDELKQAGDQRTTLLDELKKKPGDVAVQNKLYSVDNQIAGATKKQSDLQDVRKRVIDGWKFKRARDEQALPHAKKISQEMINNKNDPAKIKTRVDELLKPWAKGTELEKKQRDLITLADLHLLEKDKLANNYFDYFPPSIPKDTFVYPPDNMMDQIVRLYNLQGPIELGGKENKDIDDINKELYEEAKAHKDPARFVQILPNKARSVYYVAMVTAKPREDVDGFRAALIGARYLDPQMRMMMIQMQHGMNRDLFVDRAQKDFAERYRAEFIEGLQKAHNYSLKDSLLPDQFDGKKDQ
ncbi:MAG: hypothetical protein HY289_15935, partial [Planctomycetes bacterium]|nr:hypothetical protein [Planctomycetota bacterium]